jgi:acid phosphatase
MRRSPVLCVVGLALALLTSCSSSSTTSGSPHPATSGSANSGHLPSPAHVMVVVFENEDASDVVGSAKAPYLTSLAKSGATFEDAHGETHPSQPNYLALFSGSTQGVTDDSCPVELSGDNLGAQLLAAGKTFVGYSEDLPQAGYTGCASGRYARKHNPWVDFPGLPPSVNQPLSALPTDYSKLPTVSFVVPDLCNDMHDCGVAAGDAWARDHVAPYVEWATEHDSLVIVTFDEDRGSRNNHIATILAGAGVAPSSSNGQRINHYDVLRTLEDMYGLPALGKAADATALTGMWSSG